jgi:hypothetical protein
MQETASLRAICPIEELGKHQAFEAKQSADTDSSLDLSECSEAQEAELNFYPNDVRLPWHFCWVDDGSVAGMSAPLDREHWAALKDAGVGLVVTLTENPVLPGRKNLCAGCTHSSDSLPRDIFDDVHDEMDALFIPVPDGLVPTYDQMSRFVSVAEEYIASGRKVAVHCQAGVGRTGLFLGALIMHRYQCSAEEALIRLRKIRPQSLQFRTNHWEYRPFHDMGPYTRNLLQERFLHIYGTQHLNIKAPLFPSDLSPVLEMLVAKELNMATKRRTIVEADDSLCYACKQADFIGPFRVKKGLMELPM